MVAIENLQATGPAQWASSPMCRNYRNASAPRCAWKRRDAERAGLLSCLRRHSAPFGCTIPICKGYRWCRPTYCR
jgi:hypothetical protein